MPEVQYDELQKHNTAKDCWMAIHGKVRYCSSLVARGEDARRRILRVAGLQRDTDTALGRCTT